jgi:hypothetical protein
MGDDFCIEQDAVGYSCRNAQAEQHRSCSLDPTKTVIRHSFAGEPLRVESDHAPRRKSVANGDAKEHGPQERERAARGSPQCLQDGRQFRAAQAPTLRRCSAHEIESPALNLLSPSLTAPDSSRDAEGERRHGAKRSPAAALDMSIAARDHNAQKPAPRPACPPNGYSHVAGVASQNVAPSSRRRRNR